MDHVAKYFVIRKKIKTIQKDVFIVRIFTKPYFNPEGVQYLLFCKYQLIKYKPWNNQINNLWGNEDVCDETICEKYNSFL